MREQSGATVRVHVVVVRPRDAPATGVGPQGVQIPAAGIVRTATDTYRLSTLWLIALSVT
ncbi:hypothetical protein ACIBJI_10815 [Nocardia sp. NPDC050408]|uniref:hypothetical protein n=1 Tax=unclassified Nocardia TaxID=2637762 RepID=UPI0034351475